MPTTPPTSRERRVASSEGGDRGRDAGDEHAGQRREHGRDDREQAVAGVARPGDDGSRASTIARTSDGHADERGERRARSPSARFGMPNSANARGSSVSSDAEDERQRRRSRAPRSTRRRRARRAASATSGANAQADEQRTTTSTAMTSAVDAGRPRVPNDLPGAAPERVAEQPEPQSEKLCNHSMPSAALRPPASSTKRSSSVCAAAHLVDRARREHLAADDDGDAVADALDEVHAVAREHDRAAGGHVALQDLDDVRGRDRVDRLERLVEHEQPRRVDHGGARAIFFVMPAE